MNIRSNDNVLVIAGKDKGKKGKVHRVFLDQERVLIEGVNIVKRHTKPRGQMKQAGIVEKEAPIHVSNVMLICPKCGKPTRAGHLLQNDGRKVRVCRKCAAPIS